MRKQCSLISPIRDDSVATKVLRIRHISPVLSPRKNARSGGTPLTPPRLILQCSRRVAGSTFFSSDLDGKMAEKNFLSWVGFKSEASSGVAAASSDSASEGSTTSQSNVARIRELENQLAELRSRRDITSLTREEFEILASETAMSLIKTAQSRESKALATSQKLFSDSSRAARELTENAEAKAKALLAQAETRGRKYIEAAQSDAQTRISEAEREAESLITSKKREAAAVSTAAKREAEGLISSAVAEIVEYRSWLSNAISEAERLHRIQTQSLSAAEQAIEQTRNRLSAAFEKLSSLQADIDANLGEDNRPKNSNFARAGEKASSSETGATNPIDKSEVKKSVSSKAANKKSSARKSSTKTTSKTRAKKAAAKKSVAKRK